MLKPVYASVTGYENCEVHVMNEDNELISVLEEKYGKVDLSSVRIRLLGSEAYSNEGLFLQRLGRELQQIRRTQLHG